MLKRLTKEGSRQRFKEARDLWNKFDPIGVFTFSDWEIAEYDSYVGGTLRLLEQNAEDSEFESYIQQCFDHMGLTCEKNRAKAFISELRAWWDKNWKQRR